MNIHRASLLFISILLIGMTACGEQYIFNNPHKAEESLANISYKAFPERPKTLDPARSYSHNESLFTAQIYEPPLQYHYLKRPYTLVPLAAAAMPRVKFLTGGRPYPTLAPGAQVSGPCSRSAHSRRSSRRSSSRRDRATSRFRWRRPTRPRRSVRGRPLRLSGPSRCRASTC